MCIPRNTCTNTFTHRQELNCIVCVSVCGENPHLKLRFQASVVEFLCKSGYINTHQLFSNVRVIKVSIVTRKELSFSSIFCPDLSLLSFSVIFFCRIWLLSACQVISHVSALSPLHPPPSSLLPSPPHRATVGQTSLVVSSVDFLEPLGEAEELASNHISVKDMGPWHCLIYGW